MVAHNRALVMKSFLRLSIVTNPPFLFAGYARKASGSQLPLFFNRSIVSLIKKNVKKKSSDKSCVINAAHKFTKCQL